MLWIKLIILNLILVSSTIIGITFSKKYTYRVKELQEMKNALNIFMTKIKFTYEPIPSTFMYISEKAMFQRYLKMPQRKWKTNQQVKHGIRV